MRKLFIFIFIYLFIFFINETVHADELDVTIQIDGHSKIKALSSIARQFAYSNSKLYRHSDIFERYSMMFVSDNDLENILNYLNMEE